MNDYRKLLLELYSKEQEIVEMMVDEGWDYWNRLKSHSNYLYDLLGKPEDYEAKRGILPEYLPFLAKRTSYVAIQGWILDNTSEINILGALADNDNLNFNVALRIWHKKQSYLCWRLSQHKSHSKFFQASYAKDLLTNTSKYTDDAYLAPLIMSFAESEHVEPEMREELKALAKKIVSKK